MEKDDVQVKKLTFALLGNPNCGKTTLFNSLTGSTAYVGNWPGVTVEKRGGTYKKNGIEAEIVDLPGIYSLSPYTSEEVVSRNYILDEKPSCVIDVIDGTNLERNLYMTTQVMEMDVPIVLAINMIDSLKKSGQDIDCKLLSERLGLPVIPISALREENLDELMKIAFDESQKERKGTCIFKDEKIKKNIELATNIFQKENIPNPLYHAIKALEMDDVEKADHNPEFTLICQASELDDFEAVSADQRYDFIEEKIKGVRIGLPDKINEKQTFSDKIDRVLTNKWAGIPIFILILFIMFEFTFSEDLFFLNAFGVFGKDGFNSPMGWIGSGKGIESPGYIFSNFVNWLTDLITRLFSDVILKNASFWVRGLVCDGLLTGIFAVIGFLPQILTLFALFSILEDSGYMARIAFILDRIFRKFGLSGRAVLPMIMGFGCAVPALMNTRTLTTDKEKVQTIRVIPFFTCSAKLPLITAVAGCLLNSFGIRGANFITYGIYLFGVIVAILAVLFMHSTTQREKIPPFIMELPSYHLPQIKSLCIHIWDKCKDFLKKTCTIILISSILIWLLTRISWDWQYLGREVILDDGRSIEVIDNIHTSILGSLGSFISPIFTPLGFGLNTSYTPQVIQGGSSWCFSVSLFSGLVAKENALSSFATLSSSLSNQAVDEGNALLSVITNTFKMNPDGSLMYPVKTTASLIAFVIFNSTTIPCMASVATARKELNNKKSFIFTLLFWLGVSYVLGCLTYLVMSIWWTIFIVLAVLVLLISLAKSYDKHMTKKEMKA